MKWYWLVLCVLGVWRVTHLLRAELGPLNCLEKLRGLMEKKLKIRLLQCFYCLSLWVAAPFALTAGESVAEKILLWLACSGGAVLLERSTRRSNEPGYYLEDSDKTL